MEMEWISFSLTERCSTEVILISTIHESNELLTFKANFLGILRKRQTQSDFSWVSPYIKVNTLTFHQQTKITCQLVILHLKSIELN